MGYSYASIVLLFTLLSTCTCDDRRPIYNIAHMVNSIEEIKPNLDNGANMLEADIQFYPNGSVKETFHGYPCDFGRICDRSANLQEYMEYVRNITDPSTSPKNYANQMVMQFFDCKVSKDIDLEAAGRDLASHVMDYLWSKGGERKQEVRALVYIDSVDYNETIEAFIEEFKDRGQEARLKDVGFDGGSGKVGDILRMFDSLGVRNIWIGDGATNYYSAVYPDIRLREEIKIRDNSTSQIKKVYHWTIDSKLRTFFSLYLKVDGFLTNKPKQLTEIVEGLFFRNNFRLATSEDNPFEKFKEKK